MTRRPDSSCPCRTREAASLRYPECCGHWHIGLSRGEHAPTAEALMRSRYSAYALAQGPGSGHPSLVAYLTKTWHPSTVPPDLGLAPMSWIGLDVLRHEPSGDSALVEFVAHHKINGRAARLREASRFVREGGAWLYVDGVVTPDRTA